MVLKAIEYNNKAITAYNKRQFKDAEVAFIKAIEIDPSYGEAYANLGALYAKFKEYDKAIKLYQECIKIKPKYAGAYTNLGNALNKTGRHEEAVYFHKTAISLDSNSANHFSNCASAYKNLGRFNLAKEYYKRAIALDANHVNAHFDLATVLLQTGEYALGWQEYEWRFKKEEMAGHLHNYRAIFEAPHYEGQKLAGERVLIHAEQGYGDVLMMARYLYVLKEKGARVVLYLREGLKELFCEMACVDEIYTRNEALPAFDMQLAFMSLAFVFDKKLTKLTQNYPYIKIKEQFAFDTEKELIKIGIVWGASNTGDSYKDKVFSLRHFTQMAKHSALQLYSLQVGEDCQDIAKYDLKDDIIDLKGSIENFHTTATMINSLDLVITSDTSVAHLAGAMGKKVWVILQKVPDWRWGVGECVSRWYPSARLFHQYSLGDFNSAFREVYRALKNEYNIKVIDE